MAQPPTSPTWQDIEELLDEMLDLPEELREQRLKELDQSSPDYAFAARSALAAATKDNFLDKGLDGVAGKLLRDLLQKEAKSELGTTLSVYRLEEEIGRGGMGIVYRATRTDGQFDQKVAVKRLPLMLTGERGLERFKEERTILASVSHPFIAQLLDGGIDDEGLPYLIMELVDEGFRIDHYVAEQNYSVKERLNLIKKICDAVGFLHLNLITHGDIKPSNILIRPDGHPKLIDFGISQLSAEAGTKPIKLSGATPGYASPEQLNGEAITTLADLFALGATMDTVLKATLGRDALEVSSDLQAIINKCRAENIDERYLTIQAFVEDIDAYLSGRPVSAVPDTFSYKSGRFLRRNWLPVFASVAIAVALIAGTLISMHQANIARAEAQRATTVSEFLTKLFGSTAEAISSDTDPTIYDLLERADARLETELSDVPAIKADLQEIFGQAYNGMLLDHKKAKDHFEDVLAYDRTHNPENTPRILQMLNRISAIHMEMGEFDEATMIIDEALAIDLEDSKPDTTGWMTKFSLSRSRGFLDEAAYALSMAEDFYAREYGADSAEFAVVVEAKAQLRETQGRIPESLELHRNAIDMRDRNGGGAWVSTQRMRNNFAAQLQRNGQLTKAAEIYNQVIVSIRTRLGSEHPEQISVINNLGTIYLALGNAEKAKHFLELGVIIAERHIPSGQFQRIALELNFSRALIQTGDVSAALQRLRRIEARAISSVGEQHILTFVIQRDIALAELELGNIDEARRLIDRVRPNLKGASRRAIGARIDAEIAVKQGLNEIALDAINNALEELEKSDSSTSWMFAEARLIQRWIKLNLGHNVKNEQYEIDSKLFDETLPKSHRARKWIQ